MRNLLLSICLAFSTELAFTQNPYSVFGYTEISNVDSVPVELRIANYDTTAQVKWLVFKFNTGAVYFLNYSEDTIASLIMPRETMARFLSVDPLTKKYPELSPYLYAENSPVQKIDVNGLEGASFMQHINVVSGIPAIGMVTYAAQQYAQPLLKMCNAGVANARNGYDYANETGVYSPQVPEHLKEIRYEIVDITTKADMLNAALEWNAQNQAVIGVLSVGATYSPASSFSEVGFVAEKQPPTEPYNRSTHYNKTPTAADRQALGAGKDQVVDHQPPLVQRYYEGDPSINEKPGYMMTPSERNASANDRSRMGLQSFGDSYKQGGQMSNYSKQKKKEYGWSIKK